MSNVVVKLVDLHHPGYSVDLSELTQTCLGTLIFQSEQLLEELKDAEAAVDD